MKHSSKRLLLLFAHCNSTSLYFYNIKFLINYSSKFKKQNYIRGRKSKVNQIPLINISNYQQKLNSINDRKPSHNSDNCKNGNFKGKYCSSSLTSGNHNFSNSKKFTTLNENIGITNYMKHITKSENFDSIRLYSNHPLSKDSNCKSNENQNKNYLKSKGVRLKFSLKKAFNPYEIKVNKSEAKSIDTSEEKIKEILFSDLNKNHNHRIEVNEDLKNNEDDYHPRNIKELSSGVAKYQNESFKKTSDNISEFKNFSIEDISIKKTTINHCEDPSQNTKPKTPYSKINKSRLKQFLSNNSESNNYNSQEKINYKNNESIESQEASDKENNGSINLLESLYQKYLLKFAQFAKRHKEIKKNCTEKVLKKKDYEK